MHKILEINVTYKCNLGCNNCDRLCYMDVGIPDITVDEIKYMVSQTKDVDRYRIVGGEPTMHTEIHQICETLRNSGKYVELHSNGIIPFYHPGVELYITKLPIKQQRFFAQQVAPADVFPDHDYSNGCLIQRECGMGYDAQGYHICGCSAVINKIFKQSCQAKNYSDMTEEYKAQCREKICRYCGHWLRYNTDIDLMTTEQQTSESWVQAINRL